MLLYEYMKDSSQEGPESSGSQDETKLGRPLKFKTVLELEMAIQLYFDKCDPHIEEHMVASGVTTNGETMFATRKVLTDQKPYTSAGLARSLGIDRRTLLNYKQRPDFFPSIQGALDRLEEYAESQLFGPYANGAKFSLTNNFKGEHQPWTDKQSIDHTTKDQPIPLLAGLAPATLEVDDDAPAPADDGSSKDK
jgi:hypothetical protein